MGDIAERETSKLEVVGNHKKTPTQRICTTFGQ